MAAGPRLGIDFGTSHTVALLAWPDGRVRPLLFDGSPLLPSAVFAQTDGALLVGRDAVHAARVDPARFEGSPKRRIDDGTVLLGDREVTVPALIGAVLGHVNQEAVRVAGGPVAELTLTHPAAWGVSRRLALVEGAKLAGLPQPALMPEPVAAAHYFAGVLQKPLTSDQGLLVYDFGGGTFDASLVSRSGDGFDVRAVDGIDDLGGLDLDALVVEHTRGQITDPEVWARLDHPQSTEDRRHRRMLWDDARIAKEMLSRTPSAALHVPIAAADVTITREQFEDKARGMLEQTVRTTVAVVRWAKMDKDKVAGLFLVGGSSRVPLVATLLQRELGLAPTVIEQPELVVAEGSLRAWVNVAQPKNPTSAPAHLPQNAPTSGPAGTPAPASGPGAGAASLGAAGASGLGAGAAGLSAAGASGLGAGAAGMGAPGAGGLGAGAAGLGAPGAGGLGTAGPAAASGTAPGQAALGQVAPGQVAAPGQAAPGQAAGGLGAAGIPGAAQQSPMWPQGAPQPQGAQAPYGAQSHPGAQGPQGFHAPQGQPPHGTQPPQGMPQPQGLQQQPQGLQQPQATPQPQGFQQPPLYGTPQPQSVQPAPVSGAPASPVSPAAYHQPVSAPPTSQEATQRLGPAAFQPPRPAYVSPAAQPTVYAPPPREEPPPPPKPRRNLAVPLLIAILVVALGLAGYVVFQNRDRGDEKAGSGSSYSPDAGRTSGGVTAIPAYNREDEPSWVPNGWRDPGVGGVDQLWKNQEESEGGRCDTGSNRLRVTTVAAPALIGCTLKAPLDVPMTDGGIEAKVKLTAGCAGMWLRTGARGYALGYCEDGHLRLYKLTDSPPGADSLLREWQIKPSGDPYVAFKIAGDQLSVYVNGVQFGPVADGDFHSGKINLGAFALSDKTADASFSQVRVFMPGDWQPGGGAPTATKTKNPQPSTSSSGWGSANPSPSTSKRTTPLPTA
ncbi:Hsp70 family protein [Dactylosporangium sp. CA-233914]|uniref:Hsp70 family protein n=1 Tax=Dactylosporangium sp. CA-233914 TaxID=3239934 RepID=UPI003D8C736A